MIRLALAVAGLLLSLPTHAQWSTYAPPALNIVSVNTYCVGTVPYLRASLVIGEDDKGLPGIIYVGTLDDDRRHPHFFGPGGWTAWESGSIPAYAVLRDGLAVPVRPKELQTFSVGINLATLPMIGKQSIYMGYGALTAKAEKSVQGGIEAVALMRRKFPDRQLPQNVDPDMHRLALVQDDMTRNGKYNFVLSSANIPVCENN